MRRVGEIVGLAIGYFVGGAMYFVGGAMIGAGAVAGTLLAVKVAQMMGGL